MVGGLNARTSSSSQSMARNVTSLKTPGDSCTGDPTADEAVLK